MNDVAGVIRGRNIITDQIWKQGIKRVWEIRVELSGEVVEGLFVDCYRQGDFAVGGGNKGVGVIELSG